ncbi:MAG: cytochrome C oxidase subunit IV family protein [Chitinophagaceae bacterium]|jgi:cytochrome c oxidase subunit IV|nr:cytochrome C oxidase subunit IV family protein [Chitinophagaceae bacterium]MBK6382383.1 cytochrome C oxidase subunit IV family protein [Chitinophagaceae bacterium]MBK7679925.1 cytochrome C oxidase subunit IV family protein [Chitinophagaceae bacterium]MBK9465612.1 cytochrome C oxidase subunit IV family protein [Chitinophagaceae bacterium]MBK9660559.1 cytochrome C oxidase subunit IV family protein [Chitinophagaceae bacterium]
MEHPAFEEVSFHHHTDDAEFKRRVKKTTILLSVITIIELAIGLFIYTLHKSDVNRDFLILGFKGLVCILTLAKAYYIVSVFMHLGDEIRNMIMTIVVPLMLFIWFIFAFIYEGNSYKNLRNTYDLHFKETTMPKKHGNAETHEVKPAEKSGKE